MLACRHGAADPHRHRGRIGIRQDAGRAHHRARTRLRPGGEARNFDHPDAFDNELLKQHVRDLLDGHSIEQPIYDYAEHRRLAETRTVGDHDIVVLEGLLIFSDPELRDTMDIKLFVDADPDVRLIRRLRRDIVERGRSVDSILRQYEESVRPMHMQFVDPSKRHADVIIPGGGHNKVAIDLVKTKIRELLRERGTPADTRVTVV